MDSRLRRPAIALLPFVLAAGCLSIGRAPNESSAAFVLDRNQIVFTNVQIEGHPGRFVLATAMPKTVLGRRFVATEKLSSVAPFHGILGDMKPFRIDANVLDLRESMDGMIGADVIGPVVTIDYRSRIAAVSRNAPSTHDMTVYHYRGPLPSIPVTIDGRERRAIVDTAVPDTLIVPLEWLPGRQGKRVRVNVDLGGMRFEDLDVETADVPEARVGNRLLSRFLVVIDYRYRRVALWREPRD